MVNHGQLMDLADWTDVEIVRTDVGGGNKHRHLVLDGVQYVTEGEWQMATLLKKQGIAFTPNVRFEMLRENGKLRTFIPDFIFNRTAYIWHAQQTRQLIHGIEVKGDGGAADPSAPGHKNVRMLFERRGINVLLLSNAQVAYRYKSGRLPISPLIATERR